MTQEPCISSGRLTVATVVVCSKPALLCNLILNPGSSASSVTVYDNSSTNSGTIVAELNSPANGASLAIQFSIPVFVANGLTAVVAGTSATAEVMYMRESG